MSAAITSAVQRALRFTRGLPLFAEQRCAACARVCPAEPEYEAHPAPLCPECAKQLPRLEKGYCPSCGELFSGPESPLSLCGECLKNPPPWQGLTIYGEYSGLLRDLVLRCKFAQDGTAARLLGNLLGQALTPVLASWPDYMRQGARLIPMPLHSSRLLRRGSNQCVEIARALRLPHSSARVLPALTDCPGAPKAAAGPGMALDLTGLRRIHAGKEQRGLSRRERLRNVANAFQAEGVAGAHIILLDDVLTTGATLRHAAQSLLDAGAAHVHCAVVARARMNA